MSYDKFIDNIFITNNQYNSYLQHYNNELLLFPDFSLNNNNINIYSILDLDSNIQIDFQSNIQLYNDLDSTEYILIKDNQNNNPITYLVNKSLSKILQINKNTKQIIKNNINEQISYDINTYFSQSNILTSKSLIHNNKIYITPYFSQQITIYNTLNNIIESNIDISNYTSQIDNNYSDSVIYNSNIYYIPYDANNIGLLNINTNTFSTIESSYINPTRKAKYKKGILYNHKIYCIPYNSGNIGIIDTIDNTFTIFNDPLFKLEDLYSTAVIVDNKFYLIPHRSSSIYIYDPLNNLLVNNITIRNSGINMNKHKFIDAILDQKNHNIYCIPDKVPEFSVFNYLENKFYVLFKLNQDEPSFSRSQFDHINKTIYMIPGNGNYLGILKEPYNKINYFHTLKTTESNLHCSDGIINDTNIYLISKYDQNNIYNINFNIVSYNYQGFDNYNLNCNINSILDTTHQRYIYRDYYSGILVNNDIYMIENNGMHLSKINLNNLNITDIQILPLDVSSREIIAYTDLENVDSKIYTILGKFNTIVEYDTLNNNIDFFNLNNYDVTDMKFIKGIYNNLKNAIYMIPYNIIGIGVLYLNNRTYEFKKINDLNPQLNRPFFNNAINFGSYLYLIPSNENYIYIYNLITENFNKIDISNRNFNNNKYVDGFIINRFTYLFPNNSNKIAKLCYDITAGANLEGTANFELISKDVYKKLSNKQYSLNNLTIGINTFFNALYLYGIIVPSTFTDDDDSTTKSFEWKYIKANNYQSEEILVTEDTLTTDLNGDLIFEIFKGNLEGNLIEFTLDKLLKNNKFDNSFVNSIYDINTANIFLFPYDLKYLYSLDVVESTPKLKIRTIQSKNDLDSSLSKYINTENNKIIASIIIDEYLYMITYSSSTNAGLNYIPFIIYNLNTNQSEEKNIYNKTQGERINSFISIVYSQNINTLFLIPSKHKTIVYYNINDGTLGEVSLFDIDLDQRLGLDFLNSETGITAESNNSFFSDAKIIDDYIYLFPSDGNYILKYKIRTYYEFIKDGNSQITIFSDNRSSKLNKFCKSIHYKDLEYQNINYIYLIPSNLEDIIIYNIENNEIIEIPILDGITPGDNKYFTDAVLVNINISESFPIPEPYLFLVPYNATKLIRLDIISNQLLYSTENVFKFNKFGSGSVDHKGNIYFFINDGYILYYKFKIIKQYIKPRLPVSFYDGVVSLSKIYKKFNKAYVYNGYNFNNKVIRLSDYYRNGGFTYYVKNKITENKFITNIPEDPIINTNIKQINNSNLNYINNETLFIQNQSSNFLEFEKYSTAYTERFADYIDQKTNINSITMQYNNKIFYYFTNVNGNNILNIINAETGIPINLNNYRVQNKIQQYFFNVNIIKDRNLDNTISSNLFTILNNLVITQFFTEIRFNLFENRFFPNILNIKTSILEPINNLNTLNFIIDGTLDLGLSIDNDDNNININKIDINFDKNSTVNTNRFINKNLILFESTSNNLTWNEINRLVTNSNCILPSYEQLINFITNSDIIKNNEINYDYKNKWISIYNPHIIDPYKDWIKFHDNGTCNLLSTEYYSNVDLDRTYNKGPNLSSLEEYGNSLQTYENSSYFRCHPIDLLEISNHMSWDDYKLHVESKFGRLPYRNEIIHLLNGETKFNKLLNPNIDTTNYDIWIPVNDYKGAYVEIGNLHGIYQLKTPYGKENYYQDNILTNSVSLSSYQQPDFTIKNSKEIIGPNPNCMPSKYIFYVPNQSIIEIKDSIEDTEININTYINNYLIIDIQEEPTDINIFIINYFDKFEKTLQLEININYQIIKNTNIDLYQFIHHFKYINKIYFNINKKMLNDGLINFNEVNNININDIDIIINYNYL